MEYSNFGSCIVGQDTPFCIQKPRYSTIAHTNCIYHMKFSQFIGVILRKFDKFTKFFVINFVVFFCCV